MLETAVSRIERCCAVNPNDALAQGFKGLLLAYTGRADEGVRSVNMALRLSPHDRRTHWFLTWKAMVFTTIERYKEAEQILDRAIGLNDGWVFSYISLAIARAMQGKNEEAIDSLRQLRRRSPDLEMEGLERMLNLFYSNPTGDLGALLGRQIDSLRDIWPS